jgi:hypothetical protein
VACDLHEKVPSGRPGLEKVRVGTVEELFSIISVARGLMKTLFILGNVLLENVSPGTVVPHVKMLAKADHVPHLVLLAKR